jgi:hypothetical protein
MHHACVNMLSFAPTIHSFCSKKREHICQSVSTAAVALAHTEDETTDMKGSKVKIITHRPLRVSPQSIEPSESWKRCLFVTHPYAWSRNLTASFPLEPGETQEYCLCSTGMFRCKHLTSVLYSYGWDC